MIFIITVIANNARDVPKLGFFLSYFSLTHFFFAFQVFSEISVFPQELFKFEALGLGTWLWWRKPDNYVVGIDNSLFKYVKEPDWTFLVYQNFFFMM